MFKVGNKIKFKEEKHLYTVRACNDLFVICTKPFNIKHTVLYTIIDVKKNIRGTENLIFGLGAETDEECGEMLDRLTNGDENGLKTEISHRNCIPLRYG
jgi:hypothetical protein